jgi:hypothetical protein
MKKLTLALTLLLAATIALSACQQTPAATNTPTAPPPPADNSNAAPPPPPPDNANENGAGAPAAIDDVSAGLGTLDSYVTTFEMSFEGTDANGQPQSSSFTSVEEFSRNPLAKRTTITGFGGGAAGDDSGIQTIEVDGMVYSIFGDICASSTADEAPDQGMMFTPSDIIGGVSSAQVVGVENVNGVSAQHVIVDASPLLTAGAYANASAEAWIADFGVVRYIFSATGTDQFFGLGADSEGTVTWEYNVTNVNQPIVITAPEDCGGVPEDIPLMPDATEISSFGELTTYTSASPMADVVAFYEAQMPANGWASSGPPGFATDQFTTLSFAKDDRSVTITITFDASSSTTSVLIQLGGA